MLILKPMRNWSYEIVEREVRANVVYRSFCRIGTEKVAEEKTLVRLGQVMGRERLRELQERIVALAQERGGIRGRKMGVDTTVVESNIHDPTDSGWLQDGTRVLTRMMQPIESKVGGLKRKVRDRKRSVGKRVIALAHALRHKGEAGEIGRQREYRELLRLTRQVVNDWQRVLPEVKGLPSGRRKKAQTLGERLESMRARVGQGVRQTKARIFAGITQFSHKRFSLFEPETEIIRQGKAGKPNEFGKRVQIQEAENQIITQYEVFAERASDGHWLYPAVAVQAQKLGRGPSLLAADAGFYSHREEEKVQELGVQRVSVPNRGPRSAMRRQRERQRWFQQGQKWRTGCEGRISVLQRRHGLERCRYHGSQGMLRWVGLGIIADNLINMGRWLTVQPT